MKRIVCPECPQLLGARSTGWITSWIFQSDCLHDTRASVSRLARPIPERVSRLLGNIV